MNISDYEMVPDDQLNCSHQIYRLAVYQDALERLQIPLVGQRQLCLYTVIYALILAFGSIGNLLTIFVIAKTVNLHSHTNFFLCNLACSDLILLFVGVPIDIYYLWIPHDAPGGSWLCKGRAIVLGTATNTSILTIVVLSVERFIAICYPLHLRSHFDQRRLFKLMLFIWLGALVPAVVLNMQFTALPNHTELRCNQVISEVLSCTADPSMTLPYSYEVYLVLLFFIPMVLMIYWYGRILQTLRNISVPSSRTSPVTLTARSSDTEVILYVQQNSVRRPRSQQAQTMVVRMLIVVASIFFICYLPFHAQRLVTKHGCDQTSNQALCESMHTVYVLAGILHYVSATINPVVYNLMSVRFRVAFLFWIDTCCLFAKPPYRRYD